MAASHEDRETPGIQQQDAPDQQANAAHSVAGGWTAIAASTERAPRPMEEEPEAQSLFDMQPAERLPRKRGRPKKQSADAAATAETVHGSGSVAAPASSISGLALAKPKALPATSQVGRLVLIDLKASLVPQSKKGRVALSPLHDAMVEAQPLADQQDATLDQAVLDISAYYLQPEKYHLASAAVLQETMQLDSAGLQTRLRRLAATILLQQLHERWLLERQITSSLPVGCLRVYLNAVAYDETPMKLGIMAANLPAETARAGAMPEAFFGCTEREHSKSEASIVKLLQTKAAFAMLVDLPGSSLAIFGHHHSPLQAMSRTTGLALRECLLVSTGVSIDADKFSLKCRTVACDKAGYNRKGEQLLAHDRGDWCTSMFYCDIHALANSFAKTFEGLAGVHVKGLLNTALSLRGHGSWVLFRRALEEEILSRDLLLHLGTPPPELYGLKQSILELAMDEGGLKGPDAVVALLSALNGDWSLKEQLEFFWSPHWGQVPNAAAVKGHISHAVLETLCSHRPRLWPRHRWTGFKAAVCDVLLLEVVHGLFRPTYRRFLKLLQDNPQAPEAHPLEAGAPASVAQDQPSGSLAPTIESSTEQQLDAEPGGGNAPITGGTGPEGYAAAQARFRAEAWKWLDKSPLSHLQVMLMAVVPLQRLMSEHFKLGSRDWEVGQRSKVALSLLQDVPAHREYRVQIAADQILEERFLTELLHTFDTQPLWAHMAADFHTKRGRGWAFRILSRMGAAVMQGVGHAHTTYPTKLFTLLTQPEQAAKLASEPDCLKDTWTLQIQRQHPTLSGEDFLNVLRVQASVQMVDIAAIEARHASIRRQVTLRSVQTWPLAFSRTSAEWLLQNVRTSASVSQATVPQKKKVLKVSWW